MDRPSDGAYRYETRTSTKIRPDHGSALRGPDKRVPRSIDIGKSVVLNNQKARIVAECRSKRSFADIR